MFRTKCNALGQIVRYMARLVVKRYLQVTIIDFNENHIARLITTRFILGIVATIDQKIHQMDVKATILMENGGGDLYESPKEFLPKEKEHLVCIFQKPIYGLEQSPRAWYHWINSFFIIKGFSKQVMFKDSAKKNPYVKENSRFSFY